MSRLLPACIAIAALMVSGCAARLAPTWTINERTELSTEVGTSGLQFPPRPEGRSPGVRRADAHTPFDPRARTVDGCGPSTVAHSESRGAVLPGLGAHLRVDYWTTSAASGPFAAVLPARTTYDGILRKIPKRGRLGVQEKVLLSTFLAVNRSYVSNDKPSNDDRTVAAKLVDQHQVTLWNAFVENFCVEFIASPTERAPDGSPGEPSVMLFKSDASALCEALGSAGAPTDELAAYSRVFVYGDPDDAGIGACLLPAPGYARAAGPARTLAQSTLLGTLQGNASNTIGEVAAGAAAVQSETSFYDDIGLQIAALGDITLQRPRFGARGAETWSLADWEASGACVGKDDEPLTIERVTLLGDASFAVVDEGNHRIVRRLTKDGYFASVEAKGKRIYPRTLSRRDLLQLTSADVLSVRWRSASHGAVSAACSQRA